MRSPAWGASTQRRPRSARDEKATTDRTADNKLAGELLAEIKKGGTAGKAAEQKFIELTARIARPGR